MTRAHKPIPENALEFHLEPQQTTGNFDWESVFGRPGPNAIEIGTGNGYFLEYEASRCSSTNFLGIEKELKFYWKMVGRCCRAGLKNVRTTSADAVDVMENWIPGRSVSRLYCYFSDPWPKRKHAKYRIFSSQFPPRLEKIMAPGGELWFKTDVAWYFNQAVTLFRDLQGWKLFDIGLIPPPDTAKGEALSNYERKAREADGKVWGFKCRFDPLHKP
jgi:tRNA (guanine-N7-)-methyltransferase